MIRCALALVAVAAACAGCLTPAARLEGVSLVEGWCAALEAVPPDYSLRNAAEGVLVKRYERRRQVQPTDALGLPLGSVIELDLEPELAQDAIRLELRCGQRHTLSLTPLIELQRDPSWESFLEREIVDRLRHNRLRFIAVEGGADPLDLVAHEFGERGLGVSVARLEDDLPVELVTILQGESSRLLAYVGRLARPESQPDLPSGFVLLAGPPRHSDDEMLQALRARFAAAGLGVSPLRPLPETRR